MRTVSIFKNGNNRAIRLPRDLEIVREGNSIILRPVRPTSGSFAQLEKADPDFRQSARILSATKVDSTCKQDLYARYDICSFIMREQPEAMLRRLEQAALCQTGTPIGPNGMATVGHAIAAGAILMTNNTREFARVPGLKLEDWVK